MKEGASVLGAELTESVAVSPLESDVYVSFIITGYPINNLMCSVKLSYLLCNVTKNICQIYQTQEVLR